LRKKAAMAMSAMIQFSIAYCFGMLSFWFLEIQGFVILSMALETLLGGVSTMPPEWSAELLDRMQASGRKVFWEVSDRVVAYEKVMRDLCAKYPDDVEVQVFYALAVLSVGYATPTDLTLSNQLKAADILEKLWKKNIIGR